MSAASMTPKQFRLLSLACCLAAVVLTIVGVIGYQVRKQSVEEWNNRGALATSAALEFRAPVETTKALLIAGLLMALSGCLHLKATEVKRSEVSVENDG
jgi:hypothetical protein